MEPMKRPRLKRQTAVLTVAVTLFLIVMVILGCGDKAGGDVGQAVLIDTDFGTSSEPIVVASSGKLSQTFSGVIAEGWAEGSSNWADVRASCQVMDEEGQDFLRVNVTERKSGWAQFRHALNDLKGLARYRLTVRLRNVSADSVEMGVRMLGPPYQFYWEKKERFSKEWETYSYEFDLSRIKGSVALFFVVRGEGTVDLASLKLERIEGQDELVARLKRDYPDEGPANIIRNSRFPLGLPTAWRRGGDFSEREEDDLVIATDPTTIGPSGAPALRIEGKSRSLDSEPFSPVYPIVEHRASLWVRGSGDWHFLLRWGKQDIDRESVRLTGKDTWKRISLTFDPESNGGLYTLRIQGVGQLWIDGLQAGPKSKARDYRSSDECEVALAMPESDASVALVQFDDEPARLLYCATGEINDTVLKSKVVNAYGDEQPLGDIQLSGEDFLKRGEIQYDAFPQRPYGTFRVEAWVERRGQKVSSVNEIVVHRLRRPRYWGKDAPNSPFGAHFNSRRQRNVSMKAVGVNWVRLHDAGITYIGWNYIEPEQGRWDFRDPEIHRYRRDQIKVFAQLGTVPPWARMQKGSHSVYHDMYSQPENLADWQTYVRKVTQHYKGVIDTYFVWNEPWMGSRWNVSYDENKEGTAGYVTSREPQKDYAALMRASLEAARSVDDTIRICGFSTSDWEGNDNGMTPGVEWTSGVLEHDGLKWCDLIDYHHYSSAVNGFPGDDVEKAWQRAIGPIVEKHGSVPKPVWMSEGQGGMATHHRGLYKHTLPGEDGEDVVATADRVVRHELALLAVGVKKIFLYSPLAQGLGDKSLYATLVAGDGSLHPSAAAHSTLAWSLEDTKFVRRTEVAEGIFAYFFQGAERSITVLSSFPNQGEYTIPHAEGVSAMDLFGNPLPPGSTFSGTLVYLSTQDGVQTIEKLLGVTGD